MRKAPHIQAYNLGRIDGPRPYPFAECWEGTYYLKLLRVYLPRHIDTIIYRALPYHPEDKNSLQPFFDSLVEVIHLQVLPDFPSHARTIARVLFLLGAPRDTMEFQLKTRLNLLQGSLSLSPLEVHPLHNG